MDLSSISTNLVLTCLFVFIGVCGLTISFCALWQMFNPKQLLEIIKEWKELKHIDEKITHEVKHSGIVTKFLFRIFSKGAERYF